jgi:hypothetical protein
MPESSNFAELWQTSFRPVWPESDDGDLMLPDFSGGCQILFYVVGDFFVRTKR